MPRNTDRCKTLLGSLLAIALVAFIVPAGAAPRKPAGKPAPAPWDLLWAIDPPDGSPTRARPAPSRELAALGRSLYASRCASCHGDKGAGDGARGGKLAPRPTAFTRGVYKLRSTPAGALPTERDLFRTLTRGLHGTAMQPWRRLAERERWALVDHLKSFSPRFATEPTATTIIVPAAPRELDDLRERGEILYIRHNCGACHGDLGDGNGPIRVVKNGAGPRDFNRGRFLRGAEMEDLYLTLKVGIAGTAMPPYDQLADEELWALAAYVRVLVRERPLEDFPPAGSDAQAGRENEHAPGSGL